MPHIGCGADVLRWRRAKEAETKRLQELGLIPKRQKFVPCKNSQYPYKTNARDPSVFSNRKCSWMKSCKEAENVKILDEKKREKTT